MSWWKMHWIVQDIHTVLLALTHSKSDTTIGSAAIGAERSTSSCSNTKSIWYVICYAATVQGGDDGQQAETRYPMHLM